MSWVFSAPWIRPRQLPSTSLSFVIMQTHGAIRHLVQVTGTDVKWTTNTKTTHRDPLAWIIRVKFGLLWWVHGQSYNNMHFVMLNSGSTFTWHVLHYTILVCFFCLDCRVYQTAIIKVLDQNNPESKAAPFTNNMSHCTSNVYLITKYVQPVIPVALFRMLFCLKVNVGSGMWLSEHGIYINSTVPENARKFLSNDKTNNVRVT
jgi:hypothetical protein